MIDNNNWQNPIPIRMPQGGPKPYQVPQVRNPFFTNVDYGSRVNGAFGAIDLGINAYAMGKQSLNLPKFDNFYNPGQPVYNIGSQYNQAYLSKPQGTTFGEALGSTAKGASFGAAFGPVGMGVGAVLGLGSSLIGGRARKRRQTNERNNALNQATQAQQNFNEQSSAYRSQQNQLEDYNQRLNGREYNVYSTHG